nr:uncharacterized lipoprotein SSP0535-like [Rhipicephalus microplus]
MCRAKTNDSSSSSDDSCRDSSNDSRRSLSSINDRGSRSSNNFDGGNTQSSSRTPLMPDGSDISQKPADHCSLRGRSRASSNDSNGKRPATCRSGSDRRRAKTNDSRSSNDDGSCRASSNDSRGSRSGSNDRGSRSSSNFDGGYTQSSSRIPLMPDGFEISQKPADRRSDVAEEKLTATVTMYVR